MFVGFILGMTEGRLATRNITCVAPNVLLSEVPPADSSIWQCMPDDSSSFQYSNGITANLTFWLTPDQYNAQSLTSYCIKPFTTHFVTHVSPCHFYSHYADCPYDDFPAEGLTMKMEINQPCMIYYIDQNGPASNEQNLQYVTVNYLKC